MRVQRPAAALAARQVNLEPVAGQHTHCRLERLGVRQRHHAAREHGYFRFPNAPGRVDLAFRNEELL